MKWFDTTELKSEESLLPTQISYIKSKSFTIFGPFNILVRKHWDILVAFILLNVASEISATDESSSSYVLAFLTLAAYAWLIYFVIVNGRRLAWNRNGWKDFDDFKQSEEKWTPWGYLIFLLIILMFAGEFLGAYLGIQ